MKAGFIALIVVAVIIGIVVGILIEKRVNKRKSSHGILVADYSDLEDGPHLFLEPNVPVANIVSQTRVTFDVEKRNYISRK